MVDGLLGWVFIFVVFRVFVTDTVGYFTAGGTDIIFCLMINGDTFSCIRVLLIHPCTLQHILDGVSLLCVIFYHVVDEGLDAVGDGLFEVEFSLFYF